MKPITTMAAILCLCGASVYAQQRQIKMTFSGSMVATALELQPSTVTDEELLAGDGSLGPFTLRKLRTDAFVPRSPSNCAVAEHLDIPVVGGAGVFRFQDGSLLTVAITTGDLCIDFSAALGHLTETYQITGGTGRFKNAAANCSLVGANCTLRLTATLSPVLGDSSGSVKFLTSTGGFEGTIPGHAIGD
jgi:hypothetical protein